MSRCRVCRVGKHVARVHWRMLIDANRGIWKVLGAKWWLCSRCGLVKAEDVT